MASEPEQAEETAIGDVRRIREQFSREAGGDLRRHVEQTLSAFEEIQTKLKLRTVKPPASRAPTGPHAD
ncbi:MAG: hypothetical protein WD847_21670 [Pirellulales bacterium]